MILNETYDEFDYEEEVSHVEITRHTCRLKHFVAGLNIVRIECLVCRRNYHYAPLDIQKEYGCMWIRYGVVTLRPDRTVSAHASTIFDEIGNYEDVV